MIQKPQFQIIFLALTFSSALNGIAAPMTVGPFPVAEVPGIERYQTTDATVVGSNLSYVVDYRLVNTTSSSITFYYKLGLTGNLVPLTLAPGQEHTTPEISDVVPAGGIPDVGIYFSQDGSDPPDATSQTLAAALIDQTLNASIGRVSSCLRKAQKAIKKSPKKSKKALKNLQKCLKKEDPEKKPLPAPPTTQCIASIRYVDSGFEVAETLAQAAARSRNPKKQKRKTKQIAVIVRGLGPECSSWSQ